MPAIIQALRKEAKSRGFDGFCYSVSEPYLDMMKLVRKGRAKIIGHLGGHTMIKVLS
jgi:hypothetical protein